MVLPLYLALTAAEFAFCSSFPEKMAWMACHFSPYGTGLSNLPPKLPEGSMVILNDRTPIHGHDPKEILCQLKELEPALLLLDFQRRAVKDCEKIARYLVENMDCPVGVSHWYGEGLGCPVLVPPVPPDVPLGEHLAPWQGREIWLEAALDGLTYTVTEEGSTPSPPLHIPDSGMADRSLHCHYNIEVFENRVDFHLYRTREDLDHLLKDTKNHGVTNAVGLYQELGGCQSI